MYNNNNNFSFVLMGVAALIAGYVVIMFFLNLMGVL